VSVFLIVEECDNDDVLSLDDDVLLLLGVEEEQKRVAPNPTPSPSLHVFAN